MPRVQSSTGQNQLLPNFITFIFYNLSQILSFLLCVNDSVPCRREGVGFEFCPLRVKLETLKWVPTVAMSGL